MIKQHRWELLQEIYDFCRSNAFDFMLEYEESCDDFICSVTGLGMKEEYGEEYYAKHNASVELMVEYFREWREQHRA